jgi:hypothetical protein
MGQISDIRRHEARFIRSTARVKAFNMGLSASIIPLVSFLSSFLPLQAVEALPLPSIVPLVRKGRRRVNEL